MRKRDECVWWSMSETGEVTRASVFRFLQVWYRRTRVYSPSSLANESRSDFCPPMLSDHTEKEEHIRMLQHSVGDSQVENTHTHSRPQVVRVLEMSAGWKLNDRLTAGFQGLKNFSERPCSVNHTLFIKSKFNTDNITSRIPSNMTDQPDLTAIH